MAPGAAASPSGRQAKRWTDRPREAHFPLPPNASAERRFLCPVALPLPLSPLPDLHASDMAAAAGGGTVEYGTRAGILPLQPQTKRGEPAKLNASPDGTKVIYCNTNTVIVRDIDDASKAFVYGEHAANVTGAWRGLCTTWARVSVLGLDALVSCSRQRHVFSPPTVAKFSPNGNWVASGGASAYCLAGARRVEVLGKFRTPLAPAHCR